MTTQTTIPLAWLRRFRSLLNRALVDMSIMAEMLGETLGYLERHPINTYMRLHWFRDERLGVMLDYVESLELLWSRAGRCQCYYLVLRKPGSVLVYGFPEWVLETDEELEEYASGAVILPEVPRTEWSFIPTIFDALASLLTLGDPVNYQRVFKKLVRR